MMSGLRAFETARQNSRPMLSAKNPGMFITEAQYLREKASLSAANQSRCGSSSAHEEVNGDCLHERISFKVVYR